MNGTVRQGRNEMVKRFFASVLAATMFLGGLNVTAIAADSENYVYLRVDGHTVSNECEVIKDNDTFLVPLRKIAQEKKIGVNWLENISAATLSANGQNYIIPSGKNFVYINNLFEQIKAASRIIDGSLYISDDLAQRVLGLEMYYDDKLEILDFVSEKAGDNVQTDDEYEKNKIKLYPFEDAGVENEDKANINFRDETLSFKFIPNGGRTFRKSYMKFDISQMKLADLNRVTFECSFTSAESSNVQIEAHLYECDPDAWQEDTVTWNTKPDEGKEVGCATGMNRKNGGVDLTDYIKEKLASGVKTISFAIGGSQTSPQQASMGSRRNSNVNLRPKLVFNYNKPEDYKVFDSYPIPDFGGGIKPLDNAKKVLEESTATYSYGNDNMLSYEAVQTVGAANDNTSYFGSDTMEIRYVNDGNSNNRYALMKFDLSELDAKQVGGAYLQLYCVTTNVKDGKRKIYVREVGYDAWQEETVSFVSMPEGSEVIASGYAGATSSWVKIDLTDFVNAKIKAGVKKFSLMLDAYDDVKTTFGTRLKKGYEPKIVILGKDEEAGSRRLEEKDYSSQYDQTVSARLRTDSSQTARATRLISSMKDYTTVTQAPQLDKYGGDPSVKYDDGTGFFRVVKTEDGRWRFIDPEGNYFYSIGKVNIRPADGTGYDDIKANYGDSIVNWADAQREHYLKYGFNTAGGWSFLFRPKQEDGSYSGNLNLDAVKGKNAMPIGSIVVYGVGIRYAMSIGGATKDTSTQQDFEGGVPPVFNPDFEEKCNEIIRDYVTPWKDNPYILGWWSDNEIAESLTLLDNALAMDPTNEIYVYTHAAAWEWLRQRTGKRDADLIDVTDTLREEFREFVYDRYYRIMSEAFHKYAPNHLYLGNRHFQFAETSQGIFKAAERYCDVLCFNLYRHWTPDIADTWTAYADVPILITEWYANLETEGAAGGFFVNTTADSGKFYQNFALRLLEAKNIVGFHYFTDVKDEVMGRYVREFNYNLYNLIKYFDK